MTGLGTVACLGNGPDSSNDRSWHCGMFWEWCWFQQWQVLALWHVLGMVLIPTMTGLGNVACFGNGPDSSDGLGNKVLVFSMAPLESNYNIVLSVMCLDAHYDTPCYPLWHALLSTVTCLVIHCDMSLFPLWHVFVSTVPCLYFHCDMFLFPLWHVFVSTVTRLNFLISAVTARILLTLLQQLVKCYVSDSSGRLQV